MKKLFLLFASFLFMTTIFSQIIRTNTIWVNSNPEEFIQSNNVFSFNVGKNKDLSWFHDGEYNEVFKRVSDDTLGNTEGGYFYKVAPYLDTQGNLIYIQFFPLQEAIRFIYDKTGLVVQFTRE
jgi:hypothetical protein